MHPHISVSQLFDIFLQEGMHGPLAACSVLSTSGMGTIEGLKVS